MIRRNFRRLAVMFAIVLFVFGQETWALAGTTGGINGIVTSVDGTPISGVAVKLTSASETATGTTDASGHFVFLSLAPDTYTVSLEKSGFAPIAQPGVSVFADQQLSLAFRMSKALTTIAKVTSRSAGDVVKSGVGADIYSVNSTSIEKTAALGGGSNLNNAYSAIASVPGVTVPIGGMGWNQPTYVRGSQAFFSGFEYDGIPVNRGFDNYNASTESNLGLQELQVYTGGGPGSSSSSGTSGFINQVIKTGTYPGFADVHLGVGGPAFYHQLKVEAGGATPDRRFSYYVGLSGYGQDVRYFDNNNGASVEAAGQPFSGYSTATAYAGWIPGIFGPFGAPTPTYNRGVQGLCNADGTTPAAEAGTASYAAANAQWGALGLGSFFGPGTGYGAFGDCLYPYFGNFGLPSGVTDRENVANFHFKLPRKNGLSDDLQLLWSASSLKSYFYSSTNDQGGPLAAAIADTGVTAPSGAAALEPNYSDLPAAFNAPFGTPISGLTAAPYYYPSSPTNRALGAPLPPDQRDNLWNDTGIVKLQYTHALSSTAYVRLFGYTFFSDWTQAGVNSGYNQYEWGVGGPIDGSVAANYDLITHTTGGEIQFADQINEKNLLELTGNYTQATVSRFNNTGWLFAGAGSPIGYISRDTAGSFHCWDPAAGTEVACYTSAYKDNASDAGTVTPAAPGSPAANAGAQWVTLWNGNTSGSYNTVKPKFAFVNLSDEWRPNDRWVFNAALRWENYVYDLPQTVGAADQFYGQIIDQYVCQNTTTGVVDTKPLPPGAPPPAPVKYESSCPSGFAHPAFTTQSPPSYTVALVSPRLSATYTQSPDTVWRGSIGRFTEPPISASVQYLSYSGDNRSVWNATLPLGFNSPFHPIPAMSATQADLSLERHIRGTDVSFKISPFYNYTARYQEQNFIGPNFVTQAPVGDFRSYGLEAQLSKGDFSKNGLSGQLSLTYTNAKVKFIGYLGANQLNQVNAVIDQYNKLADPSLGAAPCYAPASYDAGGNLVPGAPLANCSSPTAIVNPYYGKATQGHMDVNGWYAPGDVGLSASQNPTTTYYDSPWVGSLILNYRKDKFSITPTVQFAQGSAYGGPLDFNGIDPRACLANQATTGVAANQNCDYRQLQALNVDTASSQFFIPNPETGSFATPGAFRNPWITVVNLQLAYDISPRVSATLTLANLYHTCFGGTKNTSTGYYAPSKNVCGYGPNNFYVSNFYNGTSPTDTAANGVAAYPWQLAPYAPTNGSDAGTLPNPFTAFFQLNFKL